MMTLINTTILPVGDTTTSQNLLTGLLNENVLLVVIFGNDTNAQKAVGIADINAKSVTAGISRKVAWMQDKSMLNLLTGALKPGSIPTSNIDLSKHIGVSVSMADILMFLMPINPPPTDITMELAFIEADV
jgi:hypothetical protein